MTKINGENVAQFMFVITDKNPRYAKQKKSHNITRCYIETEERTI